MFFYGAYGDGCNSGMTSDTNKFPYDGRQGADIYTPVYFAITWALALPLRTVGVGELDASRLTGGLWLALGVILLYFCLLQFGASRKLSFGVTLLVLVTPAVEWANSYLSTDAPTLAVGAGLAYAGIRIWKQQLSSLWLVPLVVLAVTLKVQNLAAFAIVALALLGMRLWRPNQPSGFDRVRAIATDRVVLGVVAAGIAGIVAQVTWLVIRAKIAIGPGGPPLAGSGRLTATALLDEAVKFIHQVGSTGIAVGLPEQIAAALFSILTIVAIGAMALEGVIIRSVEATVSWSTAFIALAYGPLLAVGTAIAVGFYFPLTPRYGIVLLPAFALCVGLYLRRYRMSGNVTVAVGMVLLVAALLA